MNDILKYYSKNNLYTDRKFRQIAGVYELDKNALLERYNEEFLKVFRGAIQHSVFYKKLYSRHGIGINDIKDLSDLKKLPVVTRIQLQNHQDEIFFGSKLFKVNGYTSGTTGTPLVIYRTPQHVMTEQAYVRHYRSLHGYKLGQPLLSIRGTLDRNTTHKFYKEANILYISSPSINEGTIEFYHKLITDFAPVAVEAFPSYLYKVCQEMKKKNLQWQVPNAFTSSETLYDFKREKIEAFLQTKIHDWYGNAERSILLAQNDAGEYYPLPLYSINEFADDHVVTTALTNRRFPFIRYAVQDKIQVEGNDFLTNLISPRIIQIEGRASDTLDLKDGSVVGCIDHAFKGISHLEYGQVHQYSKEKPIEIKMVVTPEFGETDLSLFKSKLVKMIGTDNPYLITYCTRKDLTFSSKDKFSLVIKYYKNND